ncbi:unnamed protein product [marine sediment metagenome]|uniref:Uncharacterized protein n=1 Tax=marine sediment metagenome TaxID=412755 RepID=X0SXX9_9ZZZZ
MKESKFLNTKLATVLSIALGVVSIGFMIVGHIIYDQGIIYFLISLALSVVGVVLSSNIRQKNPTNNGALAGIVIGGISFLIVMFTIYIVGFAT